MFGLWRISVLWSSVVRFSPMLVSHGTIRPLSVDSEKVDSILTRVYQGTYSVSLVVQDLPL